MQAIDDAFVAAQVDLGDRRIEPAQQVDVGLDDSPLEIKAP